MADFTWLDYIIFLIFFIGAIMGLARGLLRELISLVVIAVALVITVKFALSLTYFLYYTKGSYDVITFITRYMVRGTWSIEWSRYIALFTLDLSILLLFIGTMSICEAVNHYVFPNTYMGVALSFIYRITGSVVGLIRGYIFNVILILVLSVTPIIMDPAWTNSVLVPRLKGAAEQLGQQIQPGGFGRFTEADQYRPDK